MKLQKAFFLVLGLAFLVSLGSLVSGGSSQKAQVISGSNNNTVSVGYPLDGATFAPGQTLPMTCRIATANSSVSVISLVWAGWSSATGEVTFRDMRTPAEIDAGFSAGSFTNNITIPAEASGTLNLNCVAEFWDTSSNPSYTQPVASQRVNISNVSISSDTTPPSVPTGINLVGSTTSSLTLRWTPSTDTSGIASYDIFRNNGGSTSIDTTNPIATVTDSMFENIGLLSSKTYKYQIRAKDNAGNYSNRSATISVRTLAVPIPTNVTITNATSSSLNVNWSAPTTGAFSSVYEYAVYANAGGTTPINTTIPIAIVSVPSTTYTVQGLSPSTSYKFRIAALDVANNRSSLTTAKTGTTLAGGISGPTIPTMTVVSVVQSATSSTYNISLDWADATGFSNPVTYKVFRSGSINGTYTQAAPAFTASEFLHTGVGAGSTTYYKLEVCDSNGVCVRGPAVGPVVAEGTTNPPPPPSDTTPPTVNITAPTNNQVLPSGTTSTNLTVTTNENATCRWSTSNQSYSAMTSTMSGSGTTSHTASVTGLTNGTSYTRYVACSDTSNNASVTQNRVFSVAEAAPSAPTGVSVGSPTTTSLTVAWNAVTGATSYKVYRVASNGQVDGAIPPLTVAAPNLSKTVTGLASGNTYRFLVTAANSAGESTLTVGTSGTNNNSGTTSSPQITISSIQLVRTDGSVIQNLNGGETINIGAQAGIGTNISIKANPLNPTNQTSVVFILQRTSNDIHSITENTSPYTLFGDAGNTAINPWQDLQIGGYTLTVTPYSGSQGSGQVGVPKIIQFQIVNSDDTTSPAGPTNVKMIYRSSSQMPVSNPTHPQTRVTWTASSTPTDVANYKVYRNNTLVQTVAPTVTSFTDTTVNVTSSYQYKVTAIDVAGNESPMPTTATTNQTLSGLFTINNQVIVPSGSSASVKSSPESTSTIGNQSSGATGSIAYGPVYAENTLGAGQYWYVNFSSGTNGWVNQSSIVTFVPDTTPPTVTITAPTNNQVLPSGTTSTNLTVTTNENATCKWSTSNQAYSAMTTTMSGSGSTSHTASVTGLTNGTSYTRYVACSDTSNNASTTQNRVFSVDNPADTTAPTVTITAPTQNQVLPSGTTSTNLTVTTSENATCKWSANNVAYASMVDVFTGTNTTSHTYGLLGLTNGTSYTRYVACADAAGNASTSQARTFSVQSAPTTDTSAPVYPGGNASFTVVPDPSNPQGALLLDWADATDATSPVTYKVRRSSSATGTFTQVAPAFTASTYTDTQGGSLTANTTRYYELTACDAVTPTQNCTTALVASGTTAGEVDNTAPTVTITAPTQNQVLPSGTTDTTVTVTTNEAATCRWSTTNQAYSAMSSSNTMLGSGSFNHSLPISNLTNGTSYTRYIACSDPSGNASATQSRAFSVAVFVPDTSAPAGNLGVVVGSPTPSSLTISWSALTDTTLPINYRVYRSTSSTGTFTQIPGNVTGTTYTDTGRTASTTYWYKVDACDSNTPTPNCTSQSSAVSGTTSAAGTEPPITTTCPTMPVVASSSISTPSVQLCAEVSNNPNSITLKWSNVSNRTQSSATISRKTSPTATSWTQVGTVSGSATSWTDTNVSSGQYYEYQVKVNSNSYGYISAGINVPLESYKGKMILVIDNTFQTSLASQISTLIDDLTGDRWVVIPKYVSRTDTPTNVRNIIKAEYDADPTNVKAVYLLGNIPVPRAGNFNGDGHGEASNGYPTGRALSTDVYYGEMTQEFNKLSNGCTPYNEVTIPSNTTNWSLWPITYNQWSSPFQLSSFLTLPPISHKFCLSGGQTPSPIELEVGRVDMSNLTVYNQSEQTLLSNYLTKAREFKRKVWTPTKRAFVRDAWVGSSWTGGSYILGTYPSLVGFSNITRDDSVNNMNAMNTASSSSNTYLFTSLRYGGTTTAVDFVGGNAYGNSYTYASSGFEMGGVFNQFMGSYIPEWNDYNSLLKAVLADGKALVSVHADDRAWYWHSMGMGQNIGHAARMSVNNNSSGYLPFGGIWTTGYPATTSLGNGFMTLLGDPSLRMEYIAPVSSLTLSNSGGKTAMSWPATSSATSGYNVYKITSSSITKLNGTPITGTSFTSTDNYTNGNKYMVTAVKLQTENGGTYYNESLGAIATVGSGIGDISDPSIPSGLVLDGTNTSPATISFSWNPSTDNVGVTGYNIYRSTSAGGSFTRRNDAV